MANADGLRAILRESLQRAEAILAKRSSKAGNNLRQIVDRVQIALVSDNSSEEELLQLLAETEGEVQVLSAKLDAKALAMELQELACRVGRLDPLVEEDLLVCKELRERLEMELSGPGEDTHNKLARDLQLVGEIMDAKLKDCVKAIGQNRSVGAQLQGMKAKAIMTGSKNPSSPSGLAGSNKPASPSGSAGYSGSKEPMVLPKLVVGDDGQMVASSSQQCVLREMSQITDFDAREAEMRCQQTTQILKDAKALREIQKDLGELTEAQSTQLGLIEDSAGGMRDNTANAGHEIASAARSKSSFWTLKGGLSAAGVGTIVGLACGGPVGAALGAAAGGGVGGLSGEFLKKKYREGVDGAEGSLQGGQK